ncbi:TPA: hypothetical protein DEW05_02720 [Candidatus Saccharibacteria bacterium]|nr:hypothetical protein [Candidatus Saccharibacteria bacterium]
MNTLKLKNKRGFTIVELLIVIVVIGILAAITIVAFNGVQDRAKVQSVNSDLAMLAKAIQAARNNESMVLKDITGSGCTHCGNQAAYEQTLDRIGTAAGMNLSGLKDGNPWGNKYAIDENELENMASNNGCNRDGIGVGTTPSGMTGFRVPVIPTYSC